MRSRRYEHSLRGEDESLRGEHESLRDEDESLRDDDRSKGTSKWPEGATSMKRNDHLASAFGERHR